VRALAWLEAAILTIYGLVLTIAGLLVQSGVITAPASADHRALAWHAYLWDPWFLLWGVLVTAALTRSRQPGATQIARGPLLVSFRPLMDLECSVHVELPVHALLPWPEVGGRLGHGDYLGLVDLVGVPIGHNGRRALVEDVLQPIGALAIREGDQEAVIMMDRDDRCLVRAARSPPDMADDRRAGSLFAGRPQSEWPHGPGEQAQGDLDGTYHAPRLSPGRSWG
jgi:hypothetical protein